MKKVFLYIVIFFYAYVLMMFQSCSTNKEDVSDVLIEVADRYISDNDYIGYIKNLSEKYDVVEIGRYLPVWLNMDTLQCTDVACTSFAVENESVLIEIIAFELLNKNSICAIGVRPLSNTDSYFSTKIYYEMLEKAEERNLFHFSDIKDNYEIPYEGGTISVIRLKFLNEMCIGFINQRDDNE